MALVSADQPAYQDNSVKHFKSIKEMLNSISIEYKPDAVLIDTSTLYYKQEKIQLVEDLDTIATVVECLKNCNILDTIPNIFLTVDHSISAKQIRAILTCPIVNGIIFPEDIKLLIEYIEYHPEENKCLLPDSIIEMLESANKKNLGVDLTPRQKEILAIIQLRGASNKVIARMLNITESTVKLHITSILKKYKVRNRTQLALFSN